MKNKFRKIAGMFTMFIVFLMGSMILHAEGTLRISGVPKSMNIGDTFTITVSTPEGTALMSISYDASLLEYTGSSEGADCLGGAGNRTVNPIDGKATLSFKAIAAGSGTISLSSTLAGDAEGNDTTFSPTSASFTIKNSVSTPDPDNTPGGNTTPAKSSDNSLKSLTISPGTLSPSFKYSTTKYTATVASNVTSVVVDARVSNSKATVESVTGNTDLKVGENTIKITVKAENGTIAVYTITVTRSAGTAENPGETPKPPTEEPEDKDIVIDGVSYTVSDKLPDQTLPEEFTKGSVTYNGKEVEAYSFPYQNLRLLYLTPSESSSAASDFYFYNEEQKQFFPYINITVGQIYILVLPTSYNTGILPDGYQETEVVIGSHTVSAYQLTADSAAAEGADGQMANEFYLIYGVDKDGTPGWYQYDADNMSAQRFNEAAYAGDSKDASKYIEAYNGLLDKYNLEKHRDRIIMAALIFALVVAIIAIINILIFGRKGKDGKRDEDVDYVDLDDL